MEKEGKSWEASFLLGYKRLYIVLLLPLLTDRQTDICIYMARILIYIHYMDASLVIIHRKVNTQLFINILSAINTIPIHIHNSHT